MESEKCDKPFSGLHWLVDSHIPNEMPKNILLFSVYLYILLLYMHIYTILLNLHFLQARFCDMSLDTYMLYIMHTIFILKNAL